MAGRKISTQYDELGFELLKSDNKYKAYCHVCKRTLQNTAKARLDAHRRACKLIYDIEEQNEFQNLEDGDIILTEYMDDPQCSFTSTSEQTSSYFIHDPVENTIAASCSTSTTSCSETNKSTNYIHKKKQNDKLTKFIDVITTDEVERLNNFLGTFFFGCNIPLHIVESKYFKEFIRLLRPSYYNKIPSRKLLSTTLLDVAYEKCITESKKIIPLESVLIIDGWKNSSANKKTVVGMLHCADGSQTLLQAWDLSGNSETGEKLAEIVQESIKIAKERYNTFVYAVVSDNAAANIKMGSLLKHLVWHSTCSSHIGNLLAKDVLNRHVNDDVVMVLREFKHPDLEKKILDEGGSRMKLPCETRWCSYRDAYSCFIKNLPYMKLLAAKDSKKVKANVAKLIFDDEFVLLVEEYIQIFNPICNLINMCQTSTFSIADAANLWLDLKLPEKYQSYLDGRKKMALNLYAVTSYYLHPAYDSDKLDDATLKTIYNFLFKHLNKNGIEEWDKFREKSGIFQTLFEKGVEVNPLVFWRMASTECPNISQLALKLLRIPAASAQLERIFSSWGHVHSSSRNRLTFERSQKLTHLYYSLRLSHNCESDQDLEE